SWATVSSFRKGFHELQRLRARHYRRIAGPGNEWNRGVTLETGPSTLRCSQGLTAENRNYTHRGKVPLLFGFACCARAGEEYDGVRFAIRLHAASLLANKTETAV